jgi:DNA mismatch repair protein MutS
VTEPQVNASDEGVQVARGTRTKVSLPSPEGLTPAMRQYVEQKQQVGEAVLLFRMGDFYETFYDDAVLCSKVLGITLTSRNKADDAPIPLAGIPYHALENYLRKLVEAGYKVAISEQVEDPKAAKGVVKREIVRIVTAGTLTDEALLVEQDDNLLAALVHRGQEVGLAAIELAGGRFEVIEVEPAAALDELVRLAPAELILEEEAAEAIQRLAEELRQVGGVTITQRPAYEMSTHRAEEALLTQFGVATLAGFGFEEFTPGLCAAGGLIQYLQETQRTALGHIQSIKRRQSQRHLQIDRNSWRSLEISRTLRGETREGSLLHAIDRTVHPIGARRLRQWLCLPLLEEQEIVARQDAVGYLCESEEVRRQLREQLRNMADVERITARVSLGRATPRDLKGLGRTLAALPPVVELLAESRLALLMEIGDTLTGQEDLATLLEHALHDDPPLTVREGGMIAPGYHEELDRLYSVSRDGKQWLAEYQKQQIERTGLASLKVSYNKVFGYYIEVSNAYKGQVPAEYVRKQTIKNAERYITDELKRFEDEVLTAEDKAHTLEYELFEGLRQQVARQAGQLMAVADALGRLDAVAGLAELARQRHYVRPEIVDEAGLLMIRAGRHPVLDQVLREGFVPNDTGMNGRDARVFILTGPNMAGKSTYIRQVALLALLAQTGSFVPAEAMRFSLVDRIFARVGAADEIMRGQSTFMVEMTEAANLLHNATSRSLVVLDEIGRGTSTFDGLALAWAIAEHLTNEVGCRTLVATHYHELTELATLLSGVRNYNVAVREVPGDQDREDAVVFLHTIVPGGADKSYGVQVARLAGVPVAVIRRSQEMLAELEDRFVRESQGGSFAGRRTRRDRQLALFRDPSEDLFDELKKIDINGLTPLEALQQLQQWKDKFFSS